MTNLDYLLITLKITSIASVYIYKIFHSENTATIIESLQWQQQKIKLKKKKKQEKGTLCYYWISCSDYLQLYDKRREDLDKNCDWSNKV